ncbi:hypothetical protein CBS101457_000141 [Exobasidium rhododendri]|nr:hypothetical protein CBS101457_000141 [Exobasidium rhododendri]
MSLDQSIILVDRIAKASGKDAEHVRNFLFKMPLAPKKAQKILADDAGDVAQRYVREWGLDRPGRAISWIKKKEDVTKTIQVWPWMTLLDENTKKTAIKKLMAATGFDKADCFALLRHARDQEGLGSRILDAGPEEMLSIVHDLLYSAVQ